MFTPTKQHPVHKKNSPFKVLLVICISFLMICSGCAALGLAVAGMETAAEIASIANSESSSSESSDESSSSSNSDESSSYANTSSSNNRNNTKPQKIPETCQDFFGDGMSSPCNVISSGMFGYNKDNITPPKESNLSVEDKMLYTENAKVQDLKRIYAEVKQYCDKEFPSYAELCKAFGLSIVLEKRDHIYGFVETDITRSDDTRLVMKNTYIIPANDEIYATEEYTRYYNEISDSAKAAAGLNRTITTAAQIKDIKQKRFKDEAWEGKLDGVRNKTYERMVINLVESNVPGVKVKEVRFGTKWWVWHDEDDDPISKHLNGMAIVTIDSAPGYKYIMNCTFRIDREHEGGGRYGEADLEETVYTNLQGVNESLDGTPVYHWEPLGLAKFKTYHDLESYIPIIP